MRAPFPWFGGKSRVAGLVWGRFGDVPNYVEPFAGSLAVLLACQAPARLETVNDADCYVANFWRALQADPAGLAASADWPVNEADLHARHTWLVNQESFRERMKSEPDHFDVKIAGWWVWGLCSWIGTGWCDIGRQAGRQGRQAGGEEDAAPVADALACGQWRSPSRRLPKDLAQRPRRAIRWASRAIPGFGCAVAQGACLLWRLGPRGYAGRHDWKRLNWCFARSTLCLGAR